MIVSGFGQSNSPGNEQREYWHSASADNPGSRNFIGLKDPAIDVLVEGLIGADSRKELVAHTRALDRVLLWGTTWSRTGTSRPGAWPTGTTWRIRR